MKGNADKNILQHFSKYLILGYTEQGKLAKGLEELWGFGNFSLKGYSLICHRSTVIL